MNFSKNLRLKPRGKWAFITQTFWASNYDANIIFANYPDLTTYQEIIIQIMFEQILTFKRKQSKGNVFPIVP